MKREEKRIALLTEKQKAAMVEMAAPLEPDDPSEHTCPHGNRLTKQLSDRSSAEESRGFRA